MKRPLAMFCLFFAAGNITAYLSCSWLLPVCLAVFAAAILYALKDCLKQKHTYLAVALVFFLIGACEFAMADTKVKTAYKSLEGEWVTVTGCIDSEPDIRENKTMYKVRVYNIAVTSKRITKPGKILLVVYNNGTAGLMDYGRNIEFSGTLELPKGVRNPGGFDYRQFLNQEGVSALVYSHRSAVGISGTSGGSSIIKLGLAVRKGIISNIERSLPAEQAGLLNGMLIGSREGLPEDVQKAFSDAGLAHLMAVSGANVAFILAPLVFVFKKLRINRRLYSCLTLALLAAFLFITGFEPSVERAVIMAAMVLLGNIFFREPDVFTSIAASALVLMVINPYSVMGIGFQLSYSATLSIVLFYQNIKKLISFKFLPKPISSVLAVTIAAQIGVVPLTLIHFNTFSVISLVSNLVAVPAAGLVTVLGIIMAVLSPIHIALARLTGYVNYLPLSLILECAKISSRLPFASVRTVTPSIPLIFAYCWTVWFFFWYRQKKQIRIKVMHLAFPLAAVLIIGVLGLFSAGRMEVAFLDVGEGDSCFIRSVSGRTMLIDGGGTTAKVSEASFDTGESIVIPFLLDKGVGSLDIVAATHGHDDHTRGLAAVLRDFGAACLVLPDNGDPDEFRNLLEIAESKGIDVKYCSRGDIIRLDSKTELAVVSAGKASVPAASLNNGSLVLKLIYGEVEVLMAGDLEKDAEQLLIAENGLQVDADVLKVPHHGSGGSSSPEFINAVSPRAAVISVGKNNFGHPSEDVISRLKKSGAEVFRTDTDGAVILKTDGKTFKLERTAGD